MTYILNLKTKLLSGSERSVKAKKNIAQMLFFKGGHILIGLLLVPLTINYVNAENYGVWLTLSSMVAWFQFFDIGINNGLRNKLTEAIAANDTQLAQKYVSSTYVFLLSIFIPLMLIGLAVVPYINMYDLLNLSPQRCPDLIVCTEVLVVYFCLNFILSTINVIVLSFQSPALGALINFIQQLCVLIVVYILTLSTNGSLLSLCLTLCLIPIVISVIYNVALFFGRFKAIRPSVTHVDFSLVPSLLKLGGQFFVIQLAGIVLFQLVNFLIIRYYGATDVSVYNISYKYFSVLQLIWGIITTPLWSAVTDAKSRNDYAWIIMAQKKYLKLSMVFGCGAIIMLIISPLVYHIWIGDKLDISFEISACVCLFNLLSMFGSTYCAILNGLSELKIQFIACFFSPIIFLLCCYIFIVLLNWGVYSIVVASIIANFNGYLLGPLQYYHIVKKLK